MLKSIAALVLLLAPVMANAQSPAIEAARALAEDYDDDGARAILERACDADEAEACRVLLAELSQSYENADQIAARALAGTMCDGGNMLACVTLARFADNGRGGDIDQALQRKSLMSACRGGLVSACSEAAFMAEQGNGGSQDRELAREMAGKGCAAGAGRSCAMAAQYLLSKGWDAESDAERNAAWQQARSAFRKGCDIGDRESCLGLADMLIEGQGGEKDRASAVALLEKACATDYYSCEALIRGLAL